MWRRGDSVVVRLLPILLGAAAVFDPAPTRAQSSSPDSIFRIYYDKSLYGPDRTLDEILANLGIKIKEGYIPGARIEVVKSAYRLLLYSDERLLKTYRIQLGTNPRGPKVAVNDGKTPEGVYRICSHVTWPAGEKYYKGLLINYPNEEDISRGLKDRLITNAEARTLRADLAAGECHSLLTRLGGDILIHGQHPKVTEMLSQEQGRSAPPKGLEPGDIDPASMDTWYNWTLGCIGMANPDIRELYRYVPDGTPVNIVPGP